MDHNLLRHRLTVARVYPRQTRFGGVVHLVGIFTPQPTAFARTAQSSVRSLSPHLMSGEESHVAGFSTIAPIRL